jgi:hypothetical protein
MRLVLVTFFLLLGGNLSFGKPLFTEKKGCPWGFGFLRQKQYLLKR